MSEIISIHSNKTLTEHLSNLSLILGIISTSAFTLSLIPKSTFDVTFITILCLVGNIISAVVIATVLLVYQKNFTRYHFRAVVGFILAIFPFILAVVLGK